MIPWNGRLRHVSVVLVQMRIHIPRVGGHSVRRKVGVRVAAVLMMDMMMRLDMMMMMLRRRGTTRMLHSTAHDRALNPGIRQNVSKHHQQK